MKLSFATILTYACMVAPPILMRQAESPWDWRSAAAISALLGLLSWLLRPAASRSVSAGAHDGLDQGVAYRLGKALRSVWRRDSRSA